MSAASDGKGSARSRFPLTLDRLGQVKKPASRPSQTLHRPQTLLAQAKAVDAQLAQATGLGMDSVGVRSRMLDKMRALGIHDERVLSALGTVPRHLFVDTALAHQSYEDTALPIGHGQTISKPSVVGLMIQLLMEGAWAKEARGLGSCLDIGTGCGYQAAVLSLLASEVVSVERIRALHDKAQRLIRLAGVQRVKLVFGDGMGDFGGEGRFHSIVSAAVGETLPPSWLSQLVVGGRLVAPLATEDGKQRLAVVDRNAKGWVRQDLDVVQFVPLKSGTVR